MSIRRIWIALLFTLAVVGSINIGVLSLYQLACEGQPINFRYPTSEQQLWGDNGISQSFVAPRNNLNRIDILFQTYQRQNSEDVGLTLLELRPDSEDPLQGTEVISFSFNAATVQDQVWRTFNFPPISNSAGKHYLIMLQSPQSSPGNAITVGGIEWDTYAPGSAFLGPVPVRADISFRSCYQMSTLEKLRVLTDQIARDRPGLWGIPLAYGIMLLIYGVLIVVFFWFLTRLILELK